MSRKLAIVLIIILAVSLAINFFLFRETLSLNQTLDNTIQEKIALEEKIEILSVQTQQTENHSSEAVLASPTETLQHDSSYSTQSITAVGVRPVLERNGFFERTIYEGTTMNVIVSIRDGEGLVLVNTAIPTGVDFQTSAKTAVKVAENYLDVDLSDKDIIFSISAPNNDNLKAVDGQSAGAAMTVLLITELQGKTINDSIVLTGTIMSDGTIGKVGGISEKAYAAGKHGAKIFLVPQNQGLTYVEKCQESKAANIIYRSCTLEEKLLSTITEEKYGLMVKEVTTIDDALKFFAEPSQ